MARQAIRGFVFSVIAGVGLLGVTLITALSVHAQVAISEDGVTFPDNNQQSAAVIVPMNCPHGDSIVWDTFAENWVCESDLPTFAVGDTGPGGGLVFYLEPGSGGAHGLEAAPPPEASGDPYARWCHELGETPTPWISEASTPDPNPGSYNTQAIRDVCGEVTAAGIAAAYEWADGRTGGFLPNKEELEMMFTNLHDFQLGGFANEEYWSSTQCNDWTAWAWSPQAYQQIAANKEDQARTRAVRAF